MKWLPGIEAVRIDLPVVVMALAVLASAVAVVYTKHSSRAEFIELQQLNKQRDQLNEVWGRLLLEQSTYTSPGRVETQARERLGMRVPDADNIIVVEP